MKTMKFNQKVIVDGKKPGKVKGQAALNKDTFIAIKLEGSNKISFISPDRISLAESVKKPGTTLSSMISVANVLEAKNPALYQKYLHVFAVLRLKIEEETGKYGQGLVVFINGKRYAWTNPKGMDFETFKRGFQKALKIDGKGKALQYIKNTGIPYYGSKLSIIRGSDKSTLVSMLKHDAGAIKKAINSIKKEVTKMRTFKDLPMYAEDDGIYVGGYQTVIDVLNDKDFNGVLKDMGFKKKGNDMELVKGIDVILIDSKSTKSMREMYVGSRIDDDMIKALLEDPYLEVNEAAARKVTPIIKANIKV